MDGRDIGTVVLPNADLKVFLTADSRKRAERRWKELVEAGREISLDEVQKDIDERDERDSCRDAAPLRKADDAVEIDTSSLNLSESIDAVCSLISERLGVAAHG